MTKDSDLGYDIPSIDKRRGDKVIVCHGDDEPREFATWLQRLVDRFKRLDEIAADHDITLRTVGDPAPIGSVLDFCERLGIDMRSDHWEGSMISGIYHVGWIKVGTARAMAKHGRQLLNEIEQQLDPQIRTKVLAELARINSLDDFIDRTTDVREELEQTAYSLRKAREALEKADSDRRLSIQRNTSAIDRACVRLAAALLTGQCDQVVAGPLVLWEDGVVYAITQWGNTPIPPQSSPAVLLQAIKATARTVVEVHERTPIGVGWRGAVYRHGPSDINGWAGVWHQREQRPRGFTITPPEYADRVRAIHEELSCPPAAKAGTPPAGAAASDGEASDD